MCSNFSYDGSNIVIEPNPIFKAVIKNSLSNKKLLEPSKIRTLILDLYEVIKLVPNYYFEQIIDIQDSIIYTSAWGKLRSKIIYSSYDEKTDKKDEYGNDVWIIHKKYYMLIGGNPLGWQNLYMNIHDLGNEILRKITDEIINNCNAKGDSTLFILFMLDMIDKVLNKLIDNVNDEDSSYGLHIYNVDAILPIVVL